MLVFLAISRPTAALWPDPEVHVYFQVPLTEPPLESVFPLMQLFAVEHHSVLGIC